LLTFSGILPSICHKNSNGQISMRKQLFYIFCTFFLMTFRLAAQYSPVTVTGFNVDAVAEAQPSAATAIDSGIDIQNHIMYSVAYGTIYGTGTGLPDNGTIVNGTNTYQLQNYTQNNCLYILAGQTDSLILTTPTAFSKISLLTFATETESTNTITFEFTDGTVYTRNNILIKDWFDGTPYVIMGFDRATQTSGTPVYLTTDPRMYAINSTLPCDDQQKPVRAIVVSDISPVTSPPTERTCVMAVSGIVSTPVILTFSNTDPTCTSGQNGTAMVNVSGATGTSTYTWSTTPAQTTNPATNLAAGAYTVSVVDGGCTYVGYDTLINSGGTSLTVTASPDSVCAGASSVLVAAGGLVYTWSAGTPTDSADVVTPGATTTYTVQATTSGGCMASGNVTVVVKPIPAAPTIAIGGPTTFCQGDSVVLTSSVSTGDLWSDGEITPSITVTSTGTYTVVDSVDGCVSPPSAPLAVTVNPIPPQPIITGGPDTFCQGGNVVLTSSASAGNVWSTGATARSITISTSGSYSVTQVLAGCSSPPSDTAIVLVNPIPAAPTVNAGGPTTFCQGDSVVLISSAPAGNLWSDSETTPSITVTSTGTYTVVDSVDGCVSPPSAPLSVTVNPAPPQPAITGGPDTFCQGGNVVLTSSASAGNVWSTGATTSSITVSTSGSYAVTQTLAGCTSPPSDTAIVLVNPVPAAPTITIIGQTTFCQGDSVALSSSAPSGNLWSNNETTPSITVTSTGTYTVVDSAGGCVSPPSAPVTVTVHPLPPAPVISGLPLAFCRGDSVLLSSSVPAGDLWSTGATSPSITIYTSGSYTVTDTANGCVSTPSIPAVVTVNPIPPAPAITPGDTVSICTGSSVVLTSSASTGDLWSDGESGSSITVSSAGTYTVSQTLAGCTSPLSAPVMVVTAPLPIPVITASQLAICPGGVPVVLDAATAGATAYIWSDDSTHATLSIDSPGTYTVTVTAGTCSASDTITIGSEPLLGVLAIPDSVVLCIGDSAMVNATTVNATSYRWAGISDTTAIVSLQYSGGYEVTVSNSCGSLSASIIVVGRDCDCNIYMPNAFTPNSDGINDNIGLYYDCPGIKYIKLSIFDRWGEKVYETDDLDGRWDGTYKGEKVGPGVYSYTVTVNAYEGIQNHSFKLKGTITVLR
jgi:gliding motility-associated-like protein